MAAEAARFQWTKFQNSLRQAESHSSSVPLLSFCKSIKDRMEATIDQEIHSSNACHAGEILCDLNDAFAECQLYGRKRGHFRNSLSLLNPFADRWFRRRMKARLIEIELQFQNLVTRNDSEPRLFAVDRQTFPAVDAQNIVGFDEYVKKIESLLSRDGFEAIGIVGMGGVGKTALAQKVFNLPSVCARYSPRIWVCLSETLVQNADLKAQIGTKKADSTDEEVARNNFRSRVVKYMLEELGFDADELTTDLHMKRLLQELRERLLEKKYLIVFDDVWYVDDWFAILGQRPPRDGVLIANPLSDGLPKGGDGAVIVTSRSERVAERLIGYGPKSFLRVEPAVAVDFCWSIFADAVAVSVHTANATNHATDLKEMKDDIEQNCNGLPLAAKTLAKIIPEQIAELEKQPCERNS